MKILALIIVLVALTAFCSAQPVEDSVYTTTETYTKEGALKKEYEHYAREAGFLSDDQVKPTAHLMWMVYTLRKPGSRKSILANNCEMLNTDGVMLEVEGKQMPTNASINAKINFWWEITKGDCKVDAVKAFKNICVLLSNPEERKQIEQSARTAGIHDDEIEAAVEMEMRMQMASNGIERDNILFRHLSDSNLGKDQYLLEATGLTEAEIDELKNLETNDTEDYKAAKNVRNFWTRIYNRSTGVDHLKALKNISTWAAKYNDARSKNARE